MGDRLQKLVNIVTEHYRHPPTVEKLLSQVHDEDPALAELFQSVYGVVPTVWVWIFRTAMASEMLAGHPDMAAEDVAKFTGFSDDILFEACFVRLLGQTPPVFCCRAKALLSVAQSQQQPDFLTLMDLAGGLVDQVKVKTAPPR